MSRNDHHVAALEALYALPAYTPDPTTTAQEPGDQLRPAEWCTAPGERVAADVATVTA